MHFIMEITAFMETDKLVTYNQYNCVSGELFVDIQKEETLPEKMMEVEDEEDEEPIDNSQI